MKKLALAMFVLSSCLRHGPGDERPIVASVGGTPVYAEAVRRQLLRMRLEPDDGGPPPPASDAAQRRAVLEDLVDRRLLLGEAERRNLTVPTDAVEAAFGRLHAGWREEDFAAVLHERDVTPAEVKADLRDLLLVRRYLRDYVFARVAVTDAEIEKHVAEHPDALIVPEAVHVQHLVVKNADVGAAVQAELKGGTSFADAAIKHSLSPDGQSGGDLGFVERGALPQAFDEVCFSLKVGEVSPLVVSPYGYHLFKVLQRRAVARRNLTEVRDAVEARMRREREMVAELDKRRELRAGATVKIWEDRLARIQ